jgi:hypothetical protein
MGNPPVKLLDRVRQCVRLEGYFIRTEKSYVSWIKQFSCFTPNGIHGIWESLKSKPFCCLRSRIFGSLEEQGKFNLMFFRWKKKRFTCFQRLWYGAR